MPICRRPLSIPAEFPTQAPVRLSRYVVRRRVPPKATNDNRRQRGGPSWALAVMIGAAPTLTAIIVMTTMF